MTTTSSTNKNDASSAVNCEKTGDMDYAYSYDDDTQEDYSTDGSEDCDDISCDESTFSEDNDEEYKQHVEVELDAKKPGVFVSPSIAQYIRRSHGSDGALNRYIQTNTSPVPHTLTRRDSDNGLCGNNLLMVVQSVSATKGMTYMGKSPGTEDDSENNLSPFELLKTIIASSNGESYNCSYPTKSVENIFVKGNIQAHTAELMTAVRNNDVSTIRQLFEAGHVLQCCNKFGESIIHTAARRGSYDVLRFLKDTAGVSLRVCCDTGRTPMHDACWTGSPNFECVRFLLEDYPDFFCMADNRGFTPLEYVPRDAWVVWRTFLRENSSALESPSI